MSATVSLAAAITIIAASTMSHFWAMVSFAALVSIALTCLTRRTAPERIKYAVWSFLLFILIGVGAAWLMYPFSR
jgi:hypothetical protein